MSDALAGLNEALGFELTDLSMARQALTHPSYAHEHPGEAHYQRLEFLGDAVVDLCVTDLLFRRYPDANEGQLTDLRQRLVNTKELGHLGLMLGLTPFVRLGLGESRKAAVEPSILGDVVEALLGALYLQAGLQACQVAVDRWLGPRAEALERLLAQAAVKSPINLLQEWTQARWKETPTYTFRADGPDHARVYVALAHVQGEVLAEARAATKREATVGAARLALGILKRREGAS